MVEGRRRRRREEEETMIWFTWKRQQKDGNAPSDGGRGSTPTPLVPVEEVENAVGRLRSLLTLERGRIRPDTWNTAWALVESVAELLPAWDRVAAVRGAEAVELMEVLEGPLPRALDAFLVIPDSQKPALADELLQQMNTLDTRARRPLRRLTRVLTAGVAAQGELLNDEEG